MSTFLHNYVDVDECRMMPFLCRNGRCKNTMGGFSCECTSGYILSTDGQHCRDIDECTEVIILHKLFYLSVMSHNNICV